MAYHHDLKAALIKWLGEDNVTFMPGWDRKDRGIDWQGKYGKPVALMCHHTAGAATDSTDPKHPGNTVKADEPQANYVQSHFNSPASNFTLGRSGHLWVHSAYPVWHSGEGSFKGVKPFDSLNVRDDHFADVGLGVECVSKGLKKDFTSKQKWALGDLANACREASGWAGIWKRLPNHKTWAPTRKIDTRYDLASLRLWATKARARKAISK